MSVRVRFSEKKAQQQQHRHWFVDNFYIIVKLLVYIYSHTCEDKPGVENVTPAHTRILASHRFLKGQTDRLWWCVLCKAARTGVCHAVPGTLCTATAIHWLSHASRLLSTTSSSSTSTLTNTCKIYVSFELASFWRPPPSPYLFWEQIPNNPVFFLKTYLT